jgi:putative exosortase-associated protein (TIGR04073 family)
MKKFLPLLSLFVLSATALADIHEPPMADLGPIYKLGRGVANVIFGVTEIPYSICVINDTKGNSAAAGYGVLLGVQRTAYRFGKGWYDISTAPLPTYRGTYRQPYPSNLVWGRAGYSEFPPELGFESRFNYSRQYLGY